jgi:hypothetical protein
VKPSLNRELPFEDKRFAAEAGIRSICVTFERRLRIE